jgi:hypothetical protein
MPDSTDSVQKHPTLLQRLKHLVVPILLMAIGIVFLIAGKVVQRVPVRIVLDPGQTAAERLRPGLSVIATVRTNGAGQ